MNHLQDSKMEGPYGKLRNTFQKIEDILYGGRTFVKKEGGGVAFLKCSQILL